MSGEEILWAFAMAAMGLASWWLGGFWQIWLAAALAPPAMRWTLQGVRR